MSNLLFKDRRQDFERRRFSYSYCIPDRRSGKDRRTETDQTTIMNGTENAIRQHLIQEFSWLYEQPMAMR